MKMVQSIVNADNGRKAKIFCNGNWNEFVVQFFQDGKHVAGADYHDDDKQSCVDTAWNWCFHAESGNEFA